MLRCLFACYLACSLSTHDIVVQVLVPPADLLPCIRDAREMLYLALKSTWLDDIDPATLTFYYVATLCDPRFIALTIPLFTAEMREAAYLAFTTEYDLNFAPVTSDSDDESPTPTDEPAATSPADEILSSQPAAPARAGSFLDFVSSLEHFHSTTPLRPPSVRTIQKSEAELWLEQTPETMETDPLVWWGHNEHRFPNLRRMAQQYLMVPASSASAERVFSLAGRLFYDLRQSMKDGTLEERMWAKVNMENPAADHTTH